MTRPRDGAPAFLVSLAALALLATAPARADRDGHGLQVQLVHPGESIQAAIDRARPGGKVLIQPGVYREAADATNGLHITKSIQLVGLSTPKRKVVLENSGGQKNAVVAVPADHTSSMGCHSSLAPPFPRLPGVKPDPPSSTYAITGLTISGITMKNFENNGLFARGIDGFRFVDVHSVGNKNYGIFPVSSRKGTSPGAAPPARTTAGSGSRPRRTSTSPTTSSRTTTSSGSPSSTTAPSCRAGHSTAASSPRGITATATPGTSTPRSSR